MSDFYKAEKHLLDQQRELSEYLQVRGQTEFRPETDDEEIERFADLVFRELPGHYEYLQKNPSRQEMLSYLQSILTKVGVPHRSDIRELVARHVLNEIYSYPTSWQKVMDDDNVYEIKMYAATDEFEGQATIRRMYTKGVIDRSELIMTEKELERFLKRKWVGTGFLFDPTMPSSEGIFPDGSRVHVRHGAVGYTVKMKDGKRLIRPTMVITVRKFPKPIDLDLAEELSHISPEIKQYLNDCGLLPEAILFGGPTGSGKSTLFGAWLGTLPANDEIGIAEEGTPDLQPMHGRVGRAWTRAANAENKGGITLLEIVKEFYRQNYDHIGLGETKTPEVALALMEIGLSSKGIVSTTLHVREGGNGKVAIRRFVNLLSRAGAGHDDRSAADTFADCFRHLVITDDTAVGLRVRYVYEVGAFDWDKMSLPLYLVSSWDEDTDTMHFHGVTKRFANRAKRKGITMDLPVMDEGDQVEWVRFA